MANAYDYLVEKISEIIDANSAKTICDYGCGNGQLLNKLSMRWENKVKLYGIDYFSAMPEETKLQVNHKIEYIDKNSSSFDKLIQKEKVFDLIISTFSLHHYQYPVSEMRTIHNLTSPEGYNVFMDINFHNNNDSQLITNIHTFNSEMFTAFLGKYHRHHYTLEEAIDLISSNDVSVVETLNRKFDTDIHECEENLTHAIKHIDKAICLSESFDSPILKNYFQMIFEYERKLINQYKLDYSDVFIIVTRKDE